MKAPECVSERIYSKATDVYAFAITMIEILSRDDPYPNEDILKYINSIFFNSFIFFFQCRIALRVVQNGMRPQIPDYCEESMKELIRMCWHQDPKQRPMFDQIYQWLVDYEKQFGS